MSLNQGSGFITITGTNGDTVFDTRDKFFHVLTPVSGSVSIAARRFGTSSSPGLYSATHDCGAVNSNATHILGFCNVTYSTGYSQLASGLWYMVGGSILTEMQRYRSLGGTNGVFISTMRVLTFSLSGGRLWLEEATVACDDEQAGPGNSISAATVTYRIYAGVFT
jgi:hypothetical protein